MALNRCGRTTPWRWRPKKGASTSYRELFADQPAEQSGGCTVADLTDLGARIGLTSPAYVNGIREGRYQAWVIAIDRSFQRQDPQGTPAALLDGRTVNPQSLFDPVAFEALLLDTR